MDDLSDSSKLDIDQITKMVGNLDDLDNDLFGDTLTKENSHLMHNKLKIVKDTQKKVAFQDDDDDILNDILSDSNDSNQYTKPLSNIKNTRIADLFGTNKSIGVTGLNNSNASKLSETRRSDIIKSSVDDEWGVTNKSGSITSRSTIVQSAERDDSILNNNTSKFEVTSGVQSSDITKKSSLMEDLFGTRSRAVSLKDIYNGPLDKNLIGTEESVSSSMPNLIKNDQTPKSSVASTGFTLSSTVNKEPRRGRPKSGMIDDPLGLLTVSTKIPEEKTVIVKKNSDYVENKSAITTVQSNELPEWLGGKKKNTQDTDKRANVSTPKNDDDKLKNSEIPYIEQDNSLLYPPVSLFAGTQFEQQSAIVTMQQQEHELRTATILSHQADQLNCIVESQKNKMDQQEKLFDSLIKRQVDRQAMLETQIKIQQARINQYIQALVKQPQITLPSASGSIDENISDNKNNENSKLELECLLHTLEVEKNSLEHMIDILKEKHEKEIKILEDSHETQMRFMQESMDKQDIKLHREIEELEKDYQKKIEKLSNEKNELESYFKEQMENNKVTQEKRIEEIHNSYSEQIKWLQKQHTETLETFSHAKELERTTIDFIMAHKTDLDIIIDRSKHIYNNFENISDEIKTKNIENINKREYYLKNQEETLQALIEHLKIQQETLDTERKQLAIITQDLKSETFQLSKHFQKNTDIYTEREARYEIMEKTLIRERELFQEQCKWEREHLQSLKETWIAEQKQQIKLLTNERETVAAEKAKLEVLSCFKSNSDDITKAELEAELKTAHNATHDANVERQKWQERSDAIEIERRRIEEREKSLMQKAKELDELTRSALLKRDEGIIALKEAQRIEKQYKSRLSQLQIQLEALAERENKIAMEKISLSRDRLALRVSQVEKSEKDVTHDSLRNNHINESKYISPTNVQTHFKDIVDPELLLLKLNLDDKLDTPNQLLTGIQSIDF